MHKDPPYSNKATYMYAYKSRIMYGSLEIHILHVHDSRTYNGRFLNKNCARMIIYM